MSERKISRSNKSETKRNEHSIELICVLQYTTSNGQHDMLLTVHFDWQEMATFERLQLKAYNQSGIPTNQNKNIFPQSIECIFANLNDSIADLQPLVM